MTVYASVMVCRPFRTNPSSELIPVYSYVESWEEISVKCEIETRSFFIHKNNLKMSSTKLFRFYLSPDIITITIDLNTCKFRYT